jgi:hypothetical protein
LRKGALSLRGIEPVIVRARCSLQGADNHMGATMNWLLNLPPPAIMVGSILLVGAIVLLLDSRHDDDARLG